MNLRAADCGLCSLGAFAALSHDNLPRQLKVRTWILATLIALAVIGPAKGRTEPIIIRLSYKVVLNPADGTRPAGVTDADIDAAIAEMNTLMNSYSRGFQFARVDPVTEVGGIGGTVRPSPSVYYDVNFFDEVSGSAARDDLEADAIANQAQYSWSPTSINIYITNGICGGKCAFPNDNLIVIGRCSDNDGLVQLHESGHYFWLFHTQGDICGCCDLSASGECATTPGDDSVTDTLPDLACWNQDAIAQWSYGVAYASLSTPQMEAVDNVWENIMSYHGSGCGQGVVVHRLTERQLDRLSDVASLDRIGACSGRTWFVESDAAVVGPGLSDLPYRTVTGAVNAAGPGDGLLLRAGNYAETLTIDKRITLRVGRGGSAVIGTPSTASASEVVRAHLERPASTSLSRVPRRRFNYSSDRSQGE